MGGGPFSSLLNRAFGETLGILAHIVWETLHRVSLCTLIGSFRQSLVMFFDSVLATQAKLVFF